MKTLITVMMICLSASAFGQVTQITPGSIAVNEIDTTFDVVPVYHSSWVFAESFVLERVVIDTVTKCDTLYVPDGGSHTNRDGESVTYCQVEIRCKQVPRERVLWSVDIYGEIDISGLPGLRLRRVPYTENLLLNADRDTLQSIDWSR